MGAQVLIEDIGVYLYTHWGYKTIISDLRKWILLARSRWNDPEYFARIIFSNMIAKSIDGTTGYGIGTKEHDDIDLLVSFNCKNNTVKIKGYTGFHPIRSFEDFIENA